MRLRPNPWQPVLIGLVILLAACSRRCGEPAPPTGPATLKGPDGREYLLLAPGPNKPYFDGDGHLIKVEYDRNGDGKLDEIAHHDGALSPYLIEDDDDFDGKTERWSYYNPAGVLVKVGVTRHNKGQPDMWTYPGPDGKAARIEYDDDGDGKVERVEILKDGRVVRVEIDADRDGKFDRWQNWENGRLVSEELDTDGDGKPDRRLRYGDKGQVLGIEPIARDGH